MKQTIIASVVAVALAVAPAVYAAEPRERDVRPEAKPLPFGITLNALFARVGEMPNVTVAEHGMQIVDNPFAEVMIAKRNADGTVATACVDSEAAARRFFSATPKNNDVQPQTSQEK